jgi:hypothetical protein
MTTPFGGGGIEHTSAAGGRPCRRDATRRGRRPRVTTARARPCSSSSFVVYQPDDGSGVHVGVSSPTAMQEAGTRPSPDRTADNIDAPVIYSSAAS